MPPSPADSIDATLLLTAAAAGDKATADGLLPLVYDQLRKAAQLKHPEKILAVDEAVRRLE